MTPRWSDRYREREARRQFRRLLRPTQPDGSPAMTKTDLARTRATTRWQRLWGWLNRRGWRW